MPHCRWLSLSLSLVVSFAIAAQRPHREGGRLFIPVVGHAAGINSEFRSDLFLYNRGDAFADMLLTFTPSGADGNSQFFTAQQILPNGQMIEFEDIVATLFHTSGSGALEISGDVGSIVARSTTYNVTPRGKLAQSVLVANEDDAIGIDELPLILMPITEISTTRTNIGFTEIAGKSGTVLVQLQTGFLPQSIEIPILPYSHRQIPVTVTTPFGLVGASIEVSSGDARVIPYASMIENLSGDPMYVRGRRTTEEAQVIPVAAHLNGPQWATEMWYANLFFATGGIFPFLLPSPQPPLVMRFYPSHDPGAPRLYQSPIGLSYAYSNSAVAVYFSFFSGAAGQIEFTPPESGFLTTRLWAPIDGMFGDAGTIGQAVDPVPVSRAIGIGESVDAIGIAMTDERRTNVGISEIGGAPARVHVEFINPIGTVMGTKDVDVAGRGLVQFPITDLATGSVPLARVRCTVIGGEGRVLAYASVVERQSGDPTFILAE